jgi:streptogramin lyase
MFDDTGPQGADFLGGGIIVDQVGNIFVADVYNHAIRKIDTTSGTISTIAGRGPKHAGGAGDGGPATEATLDRPHGICVGADGAVYIGDTLNHRVRVVRP